ncbi:hypothetical protein AB0942_34250 [Streptomyces nodosus]
MSSTFQRRSMVEAMRHVGEVAGLPPLEGRPKCQAYLRHFMGGEIPQG